MQGKLKKTVEHDDGSDNNWSGSTWNGPPMSGKNLRNRKSAEVSRLSRPQHCKDRPEYWEES